MTKYVRTDKAPDYLSHYEACIEYPSLLPELKKAKTPAPHNKLFGAHYTRSLIEEIVTPYDPEFDCYKHIKPYVLTDVPFGSDEDKAHTVRELLTKQYPRFFEAYLEYKIRNVPFGTKVIWFVGEHHQTAPFSKMGIESIKPSEVAEELGKSAPTDENLAKKKPGPKSKLI
jgi:hypothetical protein